MVPYWCYLAVISLAFVVLERLRPARPDQPMLRAGLGGDLFYLVFNGHFVAVLLAFATRPLVEGAAPALVALGLADLRVAAAWSPAAQFFAALVLLDLVQWCGHNLLHRIPWLWRFHQVHHSITALDWIGNMRFHWLEIVFYRALQYLPLVAMGFSEGPLLALAVFSTFMGHFNHANLDVDLGALRYLLNSPRMHAWHHHDVAGHPVMLNFGSILSVWDLLVGTAHWPAEPPERLGFPGLDRFPASLPAQLVWPLSS